MKYGMMYVCGNSVEELEQSLQAMKMAMATGATMGCGGSSIAEVERGVAMMGGHVPCGCGGNCEVDDEDVCPCCGATYDEGWCGDYCENCGYDEDEDEEEDTEPPTVAEIMEMLADGEIDLDESLDLLHRYYDIKDYE